MLGFDTTSVKDTRPKRRWRFRPRIFRTPSIFPRLVTPLIDATMDVCRTRFTIWWFVTIVENRDRFHDSIELVMFFELKFHHQHNDDYGYFNPPTPTLTPKIVLLMCVAKSCIFHRMKNADFVRLLLCSMVGLIILKGESETNNSDQWRMNTNLL